MEDEKRDDMLATLAVGYQKLDDEHTMLMGIFNKINGFLYTIVAETLIFSAVICYIFWIFRPL